MKNVVMAAIIGGLMVLVLVYSCARMVEQARGSRVVITSPSRSALLDIPPDPESYGNW